MRPIYGYSKCPKILNTYLFMFSNKNVCFQSLHIKIANREKHSVHGLHLFWQATSVGN